MINNIYPDYSYNISFMPISLFVEFEGSCTSNHQSKYEAIKEKINEYEITDLVFVGDTTNKEIQEDLEWVTSRLLIDGCSMTVVCEYKKGLPQYPFSRLVLTINEIGDQVYKLNRVIESLRETDIVLLHLDISNILKYMKYVKGNVTIMWNANIEINEIIKYKLHNLTPYFGSL